MSILDNLKSVFNIDLSSLKSININIHLFSGNKTSKSVEIIDNQANINIDAVKAVDIPKLQKAILDAVKVDDDLLIEEQANKRLLDISDVERYDDGTSLIEFFRGKISNSDLEILRASLYIKTVYERGERIGELKDNVIQKHGDRGRNIVNLCTAGYFTSIIKPLYCEMVVDPNFTPNLFLEAFNTIVNQSPFAIFVSSQMILEALLKEVESKMKLNKQYGIDHLNIHGIGETNVSKIELLLGKLKDKFSRNPDTESSGRRYITVTIYF